MDLGLAALLMAFTYRTVVVLVGLVVVVLGWDLFRRGIFRGGADAELTWTAALKVNKGGPGLVFALFGAGIIASAALRGVDVTVGGDESVATPTNVESHLTTMLKDEAATEVADEDRDLPKQVQPATAPSGSAAGPRIRIQASNHMSTPGVKLLMMSEDPSGNIESWALTPYEDADGDGWSEVAALRADNPEPRKDPGPTIRAWDEGLHRTVSARNTGCNSAASGGGLAVAWVPFTLMFACRWGRGPRRAQARRGRVRPAVTLLTARHSVQVEKNVIP